MARVAFLMIFAVITALVIGVATASAGAGNYTLTVNVSGPGTVQGPGIECGSSGNDCTESYSSGTVVPLGPIPNVGTGTFNGWSGACTGNDECNVAMNSDQTVNADFGGTLEEPPETEITKAPKAKTRKKRPKIRFESAVPGATFECSLNGAKFAACESPAKVRSERGKNTFAVRAVSPGGTDASPAKATWKYKPKRK